MRILIIEDEERLADALSEILTSQKYMVDITQNGNDGLDYALHDEYDLIILDVMLPGISGLKITQTLRKSQIFVPILMLTAKNSISDKVQGLDSGADDYMTKPFAPEELLARVRALTRRQSKVIMDELSFKDLTLNLSSCDLVCNKKSVHLNFKEFEILKLLMINPQIVTSKEDLLIKVWGYDSNAVDNNVEAYISFLRKKFQFLETKVEICSLRKIGYKLDTK